MANATRRGVLILPLTLAAASLLPRTLSAESDYRHGSKPALCVSELCDGDSIEQVLTRNMHKEVQLVLRSGVELTGTVNKVTPTLVQLVNLIHRNFYDAVIDLKEVGAVVMRVRTKH